MTQANCLQLDGELKLPTAEDTISGGAAGESSANPEPAESLRHYRNPAKTPTVKTPKPIRRASEIDVRLQILQQAIKDFAKVAATSSVKIAAVPQKETTAIFLVGVGYCRNCNTMYNGFSPDGHVCGAAVSAKE